MHRLAHLPAGEPPRNQPGNHARRRDEKHRGADGGGRLAYHAPCRQMAHTVVRVGLSRHNEARQRTPGKGGPAKGRPAKEALYKDARHEEDRWNTEDWDAWITVALCCCTARPPSRRSSRRWPTGRSRRPSMQASTISTWRQARSEERRV